MKLKKKPNLSKTTVCFCSASSSGLLFLVLTLTPSPLVHCMLLSFRPAGDDREGNGHYPRGKSSEWCSPLPRGPLWGHRGLFFVAPYFLDKRRDERRSSMVHLCLGDTRLTNSFFLFLFRLLSLGFLWTGHCHRCIDIRVSSKDVCVFVTLEWKCTKWRLW